MLTTDLTLGTFNNPYLFAGEKPFSAELLGDYVFTREPYVDFSNIETEDKPKSSLTSALAGYLPKGASMEDFKQLSPENQTNFLLLGFLEKQNDPEILKQRRRDEMQDLDELQAKQMARAQKYGKESAFYGFMYQGLPKLMAQAAFSKYAFVPEMVKGVQDAYSRIDGRTAVNTPYMSVNPMRGIG
jgi:hypothetical protein